MILLFALEFITSALKCVSHGQKCKQSSILYFVLKTFYLNRLKKKKDLKWTAKFRFVCCGVLCLREGVTFKLFFKANIDYFSLFADVNPSVKAF